MAKNNLGEVQLLIGRAINNEIAQCTALRETKEESGLDPTLKKLLHKFKTPKGWVYIFHCTIDLNIDVSKVKPQDKSEVMEILIINPFTLKNQYGKHENKWRVEKDKKLIKKLYNEVMR